MIMIFVLANMLTCWLGYKFGLRTKKIKDNQQKH